MLISEGRIDEETLKSMNRDKELLLQALKQKGYSQIENVFYCEWTPDEGLYIATYEDDSPMDIKLEG